MTPKILRPKGTDLKSISDFNSDWADRIAFLILVGLAVDIVAVFVSDDTWRKGLAILANSLIALGVWGELWFAKRAREADDSRVAEANAVAAKAHERAAGLETEAASLRYVLDQEIQKRTQRLLAEEQKAILFEELEGNMVPRLTFVVQRDLEAQSFALQFMIVLHAMGIQTKRVDMPAGQLLHLPNNGVAMYSPSAKTAEELENDPLHLALTRAKLLGGTFSAPLVGTDLSIRIRQDRA